MFLGKCAHGVEFSVLGSVLKARVIVGPVYTPKLSGFNGSDLVAVAGSHL